MKSNRSIALIGCGYWGKNLLRNLSDLGVLRAVCDTDAETLKSLKRKFPHLNVTSNFKEILNSPDIKSLVISTPAVTHFELVKNGLLNGKDIFVEKPLAMNIKDAGVLVNLAKRKNKILMVGHLLQYHPAILKLKQIIDRYVLGKLQYIYSSRLNLGKLRTEENILWSFAPHDISVMLMLLGKEPIKVRAFGGSYITEGIYDITNTILEFRDGVKGHIYVSWLHPYKEQKLIVIGSKAMAVFDDLTEEKLFIYPHRIELKKGKTPLARKADHYIVRVDKREPLREELRHFINSVAYRRKPKTDGDEALRVLKILERAEKDLVEG